MEKQNSKSLHESGATTFFSLSDVPRNAHKNPPDLRRKTRLHSTLLSNGHMSITDTELIELALYHSDGKSDLKKLSNHLINQFDSFSKTISATVNQLATIPDMTVAMISKLKLIEAGAHRLSREEVKFKNIISSKTELIDYCRVTMAHTDIEQFRVLFADKKNTLIADDLLQSGTIDHVTIYPREVIKRALMLNASALIIVHNHPSGDPNPSEADVTMTHELAAAANTFDIVLHDHLIIGSAGTFSFRAEKLL